MKGKPTVAVDLDGVLAKYDGWKGVDHIGDPIYGAVEFTKRLSKWAHVTIFTTRLNCEVNKVPPHSIDDLYYKVLDWLKKHAFSFDEIYLGQGKPLAVAYIDDRAVPCTPQREIITTDAFRGAEERAKELAKRESKETHKEDS